MEDIKFNHTLPIQLRFNDVDKFGHVNNTVYFSFYDLGKTEYFASVCPHVDWQKDGIVVVHIEANFLAQIYGSDHIAVQTAVTQIGTKSFSSCATCHRYRDAGSKMYMHFRHGSLRPQQARIQTADRRVDRSYLQIRGAGFTKKITQYRPLSYKIQITG